MSGPRSKAAPAAGLAGLVRLVHPFPSLLDGAVTTGVAVVAGGTAGDALRLGAAMAAIQFSIGTLNDLVDADRDAGLRPAKPIPAGLVARRVAWLVFAVTLALGLLLALPSGPATVAVALAGAGVGYAYDLWLKGTPWSWVGFAAGLPLLPVFAWVGATGALPPEVALFAGLAALAGAALALANALADLDRDAAAATQSVAVRLGRGRTGWLVVLLQAAVLAGAVGSMAVLGPGGPGEWWLPAIGGVLAVAAGVALTIKPARRVELGWEFQGIGLGLLAVGWAGAAVAGGAI